MVIVIGGSVNVYSFSTLDYNFIEIVLLINTFSTQKWVIHSYKFTTKFCALGVWYVFCVTFPGLNFTLKINIYF
jgi:hypothetical protein